MVFVNPPCWQWLDKVMQVVIIGHGAFPTPCSQDWGATSNKHSSELAQESDFTGDAAIISFLTSETLTKAIITIMCQKDSSELTSWKIIQAKSDFVPLWWLRHNWESAEDLRFSAKSKTGDDNAAGRTLWMMTTSTTAYSSSPSWSLPTL